MINALVLASKALLGECSTNGSFRSDKVGNFGIGFENFGWYEERKLGGVENGEVEGVRLCSELICKIIYGWRADFASFSC